MGRHTTFTQETFDLICERLSQGLSLREICRADDMPDEHSVRRWVIADYNGIAPQYARARQAQAEHWADEILLAADDGTNDYVERVNAKGEKEMALDREHIQRSALRVEARKWLLSKLLPKTYGDRTKLDVTHNNLSASSAGDETLIAIARTGSSDSAAPPADEAPSEGMVH